ncbi:MAG TPA: hypothetical protein VKY82_05530 [Flavobacterium sp.]|nr:hypothetical protein [Flavobacterium sp.]
MNVTDTIISFIDRFQTLYEWFLRFIGRVVDLFDRFKDLVLSLVEYVIDTFDNEQDANAFLKNYLENEHSFI